MRPGVTIPQSSSNTLDESRLGNYRMLSMLARGGTASVYLAEHLLTRERVALKLLHPSYMRRAELVEQFLKEHEVAAAASHPGLINVLHSDKTPSGAPYIVMELLDGENLAKLVETDRVSIEAIYSIGIQTAAAVSAIHRANYIHCDIKPDNVFVLFDEFVGGWPMIKVIDYGVSRSTLNAASQDGTISGTPAYMSPEQWHGEPSPKSDVYALGCMLYELIVGEQPFHGSLPQLMLLHAEHLPLRPSQLRSEVPDALDVLVIRMLAKDPAMRPTMTDVESILRKIASYVIPLELSDEITDAIAS